MNWRCWIGWHKMKVDVFASLKDTDGEWRMINQKCSRSCGRSVNNWAIETRDWW